MAGKEGGGLGWRGKRTVRVLQEDLPREPDSHLFLSLFVVVVPKTEKSCAHETTSLCVIHSLCQQLVFFDEEQFPCCFSLRFFSFWLTSCLLTRFQKRERVCCKQLACFESRASFFEEREKVLPSEMMENQYLKPEELPITVSIFHSSLVSKDLM